ncbi:threonine synthase [Photobacterium phosphoreum]|uniref:threonine synthase n=1 Tax=Photobacterium phosphoreum TaxID=659 RepID=UPI0007F86B3B|nr:threonine synthase [Photobacterium phosphoreum]OBU27717.1 threonine synthase [Photobacterium phosphoreum]PSW36468.1 threonine synthase [Photobacterium phosphoreum]
MKLYNLKEHQQQVSFGQAVRQGLGRQQGLFFPAQLPQLGDIDALLAMDFVSRSSKILSAFIGEELSTDTITQMVDSAFQFPAPIKQLKSGVYALELFHGPTLAFKDFGGRFMAQSLAAVTETDGNITILTATSGDTGAAVAHAFYGMDNIQVVILYPKGKISPLQEKLFCTLGKNITTVAVNGTFDDCQALVKQAFDDGALREDIGLNSANSINISRLMAQICYYFEAVSQLSKAEREQLVISVPSGNFGNLTAGLLAKSLGLPVKRFIAATNVNDTVPRYLQTGEWTPNATVATISNAMDVSQPNNWPRIEELCQLKGWGLNELGYGAVDDQQTAVTLKQMYADGYLCEPHGAIAYNVLEQQLAAGETGLFLCTAHPAKFKDVVDDILDTDLPLPAPLAKHNAMPLLSLEAENDFAAIKTILYSAQPLL